MELRIHRLRWLVCSGVCIEPDQAQAIKRYSHAGGDSAATTRLTMDWKELLTLATGIFGLVFSLIAYRRAKAAEERAARLEQQAARLEQQALVDAVVTERQQALSEIQTMKTLWETRGVLLKAFGASDDEFASYEQSKMSTLELYESLVKFEVAQVSKKQDLVAFRLKWNPALLIMRAKEETYSKLFEVTLEKLKLQHDKRTPAGGDA